MKTNSLSIIILSGNEQDVILQCLKSCMFADEIVVYSNSTDNTNSLIKKNYPKVNIVMSQQATQNFNFAKARNQALKHAHSNWIFFVDADEIVTPELRKDILFHINKKNNLYTNYDIPRANYFMGKRVKHGGTYPDYVKRLFLKKNFEGYTGIIHEQPQITGPSAVLKNDLLHFTHRDLHSMVQKSLKWTKIEAELIVKSNHPPIVWWRIIRMMLTKFFERYVSQQMYKDGIIGLISSMYETFDTYMIYSQAYELQLNKHA